MTDTNLSSETTYLKMALGLLERARILIDAAYPGSPKGAAKPIQWLNSVDALLASHQTSDSPLREQLAGLREQLEDRAIQKDPGGWWVCILCGVKVDGPGEVPHHHFVNCPVGELAALAAHPAGVSVQEALCGTAPRVTTSMNEATRPTAKDAWPTGEALSQPHRVVTVKNSEELEKVLNEPEPNVKVMPDGSCQPAQPEGERVSERQEFNDALNKVAAFLEGVPDAHLRAVKIVAALAATPTPATAAISDSDLLEWAAQFCSFHKYPTDFLNHECSQCFKIIEAMKSVKSVIAAQPAKPGSERE